MSSFNQTINDFYMIKNNICPYNYYGYCEKDNCTFKHLKPNKPTICINYIKHGFCQKENCKRIHENVKINKLCKFYNKNTCYKSDKCNFLHMDIDKNADIKKKDNNIIDLRKLYNKNIKIIKIK